MKINQLVSVRYFGLLGMRVIISQLPPYIIRKTNTLRCWFFLFDTLLTHFTCLACLSRCEIVRHESIGYKFW